MGIVVASGTNLPRLPRVLIVMSPLEANVNGGLLAAKAGVTLYEKI